MKRPNNGFQRIAMLPLKPSVGRKTKMKIYDPNSKRILKNVTLFLTPEEAADLSFSAKDLSENPEKHHHHVSDREYKTQITVSVYTNENITSFDEESRGIIQEKD
jgi:hypothetical protein